MAGSIPNYEKELRRAMEILINFVAFTEKAKLNPEKDPNLEQSMPTYISIITELTHKARDGHNNCREYLNACHPLLMRPTPGRDKDKHNTYSSTCHTDSGISSGIIAEETGDADERESDCAKESNA